MAELRPSAPYGRPDRSGAQATRPVTPGIGSSELGNRDLGRIGDLEVIHQTSRPRAALSSVGGRDDQPHEFTVLHIVRNMGGGVATAIIDYAAAVPEARHIVLCDLETSFQTSDTFPFAVTHRMPRGFTGAVAAIRRTVAEYQPDVIHAHSSFAGLYVRTGLGRDHLRRVVYTPHCYAFARRDVSRLTRALFWLIECALTLRAPVVLACSPDEERAATRFIRSWTAYAPNVANVPDQVQLTVRDAVPRSKTHLIVTIGRMCAQKDPDLFLDAALAARAEGLDFDWLWIGGGDDDTEDRFREHGIAHTGWIPRSAALAALAQADLYLHTAAWEGAPISVLEAAALKIPVLARRTSSLASLGLRPLWNTTDELMAMLRQGITGDPISESRTLTAGLLDTHTVEAQREGLLSAYRHVRQRGRRAPARKSR